MKRINSRGVLDTGPLHSSERQCPRSRHGQGLFFTPAAVLPRPLELPDVDSQQPGSQEAEGEV